MLRKILSSLFIFSLILPALYAQTCQQGSIQVPDRVCPGIQVSASSNFNGQPNVRWSLEGDLLFNPPLIQNLFASPANNGNQCTAILKGLNDTAYHYFFLANTGLNRVDYPNGLFNASNQPVVLGNPQGMFNGAAAIAFEKINGRYQGLVLNRNNNTMLLLDFGNNPTNMPTVSMVNTPPQFPLIAPAGIEVVVQDGIYYAAILNQNASYVHLLNFGSNLLNTNPTAAVIPTPGLAAVMSVNFVRDCNGWNIYIPQLFRNEIGRIRLGPNLASIQPNFTQEGFSVQGIRSLKFYANRGKISAIALRSGSQITEYSWDSVISGTPEVRTFSNLSGVLGELQDAKWFISPEGEKMIIGTSYQQSLPLLQAIRFRPQYPGNYRIGQSAVLSGLKPGNYLVQSEVTYPNSGLMRVLKKNLIVEDSVFPGFTATKQCVEDSVKLKANPNPLVTNTLWDFGNGLQFTGESVARLINTPGNYKVTLTQTTVTGCIYSSLDSFKVFPTRARPISSFTIGQALCQGKPLPITENSFPGADGAVFRWQWQLSDGQTFNERNPTIIPADTGRFSLTLLASDSSGCGSALIRSFNVLPAPEADFRANLLCPGDSTVFFDRSNLIGQVVQASFWSFQGSNQVFTGTQTGFRFPGTGSYSVTYRIVTNTGCEDVLIRQVNILPKPASILSLPTLPETGQQVSLRAIILNQGTGLDSVNWTVVTPSGTNNYLGNNLNGTSWVPTDSGTHFIRLRATTNVGCVLDTSVLIRVFSACPDFIFQCLADTISIGDQVPLAINNGGGFNITYDLSAGDQLNNPLFRYIPTGYSAPAMPALIVDTGGIYGFVPLAADPNFNQGQAVLRLDFGKNPESTPIITPIGSFGALNPQNLDIHKTGDGRYFGILPSATGTSGWITILNFGTNLRGVPTATTINNPQFVRIAMVKWLATADSLFAFAVSANPTANQSIYRLAWPGNAPIGSPIISILNNALELQANGGINAIELVKDCNLWYGALGGESGGIYLLRFGRFPGGSFQIKNIAPSLQQLGVSNALSARARALNYFFELGNWYLRVSTGNNRSFLIKLGSNPFNDPTEVSFPRNTDNLGLLSGFSIKNINGKTYGLASIQNLGGSALFVFPDNAIADTVVFNPEPTATPSVRAAYSGKFYLSATATAGNGNTKTYFDSVYVRPVQSGLVTQCFGLQAAAPGATCSNQRVNLAYNYSGTGQAQLTWDACPGDLNFNPVTPTSSGINIPSNNVSGIHILRTGNTYTGFMCSKGDGAIFRLDYPGLDVKESPTIVPLPSLTYSLQPTDLKLVNFNNRWILYITFSQTGSSYLGVVNFGANIQNSSPVVNLINLGSSLSRPTGVEVIQEPDKLVLLATSQFSNQLAVLDFGNRPTDVPKIQTYSISGASSGIKISAIKECNKWGGVIADYTGNALRYFLFDNGLNNPPVFTSIALPQVGISPTCVAVVRDNAEYYAIFGAEIAQGQIYRVGLGASLLNPTFSPVTNLGLASQFVQFNQGISLIKNQSSEWVMNLAVNLNMNDGRRLTTIVFPNNCRVSNPIQTGIAPNFQFQSPGFYDIVLEGQDAENRMQHTKTTVNITNPIIADFTTTGALCITDPVRFLDRSISGGGLNPTYRWNFGDTSDISAIQSTAVNPTHQYRAPGQYTVRLKVQDAGGCVNEKTLNIRVFGLPVPAFTISENCSGDSISLIDNSNPSGDSLVFWRWEILGIDTVFGKSPRIRIPVRGVYQTKLTVRGRRGCEASFTDNLRITRIAATADFTWVQNSNCLGDTLKLNDRSLVNGTTILSTQWDFGIFGTSTEPNPRVFINRIGNWPIKLTLINGDGCTSILTKIVQVLPKPAGNIGPLTVCERDSVRFRINNNTAIANRKWFFFDGTTDTLANPSKVFPIAGEYPVKVWVRSNNGCTDTLYAIVLVQPAPRAQFSWTGSCEGGPVQFNSNASTTGGIPGGITAWFWDFGQGQTSAAQNPVAFFNSGGLKQVRLTVTAGNCTNTLIRNVLISPKPGFEPNIQPGCDTLPTRFSLINIRRDTLTQIAWEINGITYNDSSVSIRLPQSLLPYNVRLSITNRRGCNAVFSRDFVVGSKPLAHFRLQDSLFANAPYRLRLVNSSQNANFYRWEFGNGDTSSAAVPNYSFPQPGVYRVKLYAYTSTQCFDVFEKVVSVVPVVRRNISVKEVRLLASAGRVQTTVVLKNKGTVALSGIDLLAEFQGGLTIRERFAGTILPTSEAVYNFVSQALQDRNGLQVVCVSALLPDDDSLSDNSLCGSLASSFTVLPLNPNPAERGSPLSVRYSLPSEGGVKVVVVDVLGRESYTLFDGVESAGYKEKTISVNSLTPGLYSVRVIFQDESVTQRLVVR